MLAEVPAYRDLQHHVAEAAAGIDAGSILELGVGTGETASAVLAVHPGARLTGIDENEPMLARARECFPAADLRVQRLEDPLPEGNYDLVVSALTVHHLDTAGKRICFAACAAGCVPAGASSSPMSLSPTILTIWSPRSPHHMTSRARSPISSAGSGRRGSSQRCGGMRRISSWSLPTHDDITDNLRTATRAVGSTLSRADSAICAYCNQPITVCRLHSVTVTCRRPKQRARPPDHGVGICVRRTRCSPGPCRRQDLSHGGGSAGGEIGLVPARDKAAARSFGSPTAEME